jgi:hypothetical protein
MNANRRTTRRLIPHRNSSPYGWWIATHVERVRAPRRTDGLGRRRFGIRDDLERTWAHETRLERQEKKQEGTTPQLTGKHAPPRA